MDILSTAVVSSSGNSMPSELFVSIPCKPNYTIYYNVDIPLKKLSAGHMYDSTLIFFCLQILASMGKKNILLLRSRTCWSFDDPWYPTESRRVIKS